MEQAQGEKGALVLHTQNSWKEPWWWPLWMIVQNSCCSAKMMKSVKFWLVVPDSKGCGGFGVFFVFNWIALLLFCTFVGTLAIYIWCHPFF